MVISTFSEDDYTLRDEPMKRVKKAALKISCKAQISSSVVCILTHLLDSQTMANAAIRADALKRTTPPIQSGIAAPNDRINRAAL
jgi:hypothetical protein